jgi:hypothetical protein
VQVLKTHEWQPLHPVTLYKRNSEEFFTELALIDSGADISCIPLQLGKDLGFVQQDQ